MFLYVLIYPPLPYAVLEYKLHAIYSLLQSSQVLYNNHISLIASPASAP
jgi:hypothetical protein